MEKEAINKNEVLRKAENIKKQFELITNEFLELRCGESNLQCDNCPLEEAPAFLCDFFHSITRIKLR